MWRAWFEWISWLIHSNNCITTFIIFKYKLLFQYAQNHLSIWIYECNIDLLQCNSLMMNMDTFSTKEISLSHEWLSELIHLCSSQEFGVRFMNFMLLFCNIYFELRFSFVWKCVWNEKPTPQASQSKNQFITSEHCKHFHFHLPLHCFIYILIIMKNRKK